MNEFKRHILMKVVSEDPIPPTSYFYNISKGTQICSGGYVNIGGTITSVGVYANTQRTNWVDGTVLYSDINLTVRIPDSFYRSITGGTIDLFYFNTTNGVISNYTPPMSPC